MTNAEKKSTERGHLLQYKYLIEAIIFRAYKDLFIRKFRESSLEFLKSKLFNSYCDILEIGSGSILRQPPETLTEELLPQIEGYFYYN
ncbi:MAG: hypothetical protein ACRCZB_05440 [Bacteroidales bacterium]